MRRVEILSTNYLEQIVDNSTIFCLFKCYFLKMPISIILCDVNEISTYFFFNVEEQTNSERPNEKIHSLTITKFL